MKSTIKLISVLLFVVLLSSAALATPEQIYGVELSLNQPVFVINEYTMPPYSAPNLRVNFRVFNRSEDAVEVRLEDGCMYDITINKLESGEVVHDHFLNTLCTQQITTRIVREGEDLVFSEDVRLVDQDRQVLPRGNYVVEFSTRSFPRYSAKVCFRITNELGE